jgi:hypothetical protein
VIAARVLVTSVGGLALIASACARPPSARAAPAPAAPGPTAPAAAAPAAPLVPAAAVPAPSTPPPLTLQIPRITTPLKIDAEVEGKKVWEEDVGATGNFKDDAGRGMVPYTEAKARWGNGNLYLLLYAGDLDLEGTVKTRDGDVERDDAFHLELGPPNDTRVIAVSVLGTVADAACRGSGAARACDRSWNSGSRVAVDRDGTLNKIGDNDEEWVVEMAVPLAAIGFPNAAPGTRIPFSVHRCEVGHGSCSPGCGGWGTRAAGALVLGP